MTRRKFLRSMSVCFLSPMLAYGVFRKAVQLPIKASSTPVMKLGDLGNGTYGLEIRDKESNIVIY